MTSEPDKDKTKQSAPGKERRRKKPRRSVTERLRKSSAKLIGGTPSRDGTDLFSQISMMVGAFLVSPVRNTLIALGAGIFALVVLIAIGQVAINRWNEPFYDALARRDLQAFFHQLMVFFGIAGALLLLNVSQTWLNQMFKLKMREGLARDLVGQWLAPGRAFRLANAGEIGINPDQRLHEDARHFAEMSCDLGINLLQSTVILVSFVGVLWSLSSGFVFHVAGYSFSIPGYMVWAVILYAASASWLTWIVGRSLVNINANRYAREADFRASLMRVNEHLDAITLSRGEGDERRRLDLDIDAVLGAIRKIVYATTRLTWVTAGYGWLTIVAPILVAAPVYFGGGLTFGGLMMAVGAFTQVHNALRWFVDNFGAIADWRATLLRVASFRQAVLHMDALGHLDRQIDLATNDDDRLTLDNVSIAAPDQCLKLSRKAFSVKPGERVLVTGGTETQRTLLFRALGGLWPWGEGRIGMPAGDGVAFMPRAPYFPPGNLKGVIVYPLDIKKFSEQDLENVLRRAGLERLATSLDHAARWDRVLTDDERQCIAFARLILQKPQWIVIDGALDGLDAEAYDRIRDMLNTELKDAAVIHLGKPHLHDGLFTQQISLEDDPSGKPLEVRAVKTA
ncbi:ABC transporter ATP-binding protein/permease [Brucella sp. RRSP16]|uniref:ATP-binding cassette transporter n=3 Tax=Brucella intermedia TaxID=94625 RepID=A0ABR6AIK9_9HYPH|nr:MULTISPECIES: ABC transporter ATP-binding protein/permease [Brucella/Ochrobactrum group]ERI13866.1 glycosyl transferase family 1 [Ochrobactrum sp. EGD-AQ16]KAB2696752.1 ABC transporter ATP-binding protein/permease [Brucella intermedia]KAB2708975.1 ABC transporter ATP-binding protein/permease [Brucella intermedia]MBA8849284.1 putative ATP-binding cassette transporter [Brucella intermedia]MCH6204699.1 ABC transporter ATP-binding protein/permease [Brucella ciceri]